MASTFFTTMQTWLSSLRQTVFSSPQNIILTSLATTTVFIVCSYQVIQITARYQHRVKRKHESHKCTTYTNKLPKGSDLTAPEPGTVMVRDFRVQSSPNQSPSKTADELRVVTWNVERGYRTNEIIQQLKKLNADIILLQEVDIGCRRSQMLDVAHEIANALQMQCVYGADCWHINGYHENEESDQQKFARMQYNTAPHNGCEGNAILTRLDIIAAYPVVMPCVRNQYRPKHDHLKRHTAVVAVIDTKIAAIGELACYSLHMDAYSGRVQRANVQYKAVYADIMRHHSGYNITQDNGSDDVKIVDVEKKRRAVIVGGDFNTHNHGVARFINSMCGGDELRYKMWGMSEAQWWNRFVIGKEVHLMENVKPMQTVRLKDPFDAKRDVTHTARVAGVAVWSGKIDWLLCDVEKLVVVKKCVSNVDVSDHEYLLCDIKGKE